ncbi:MAG: hypothetical protein COV46_04870 [Deltaproteobacteria bacterium CG11_big_fil_rev_8_21_14_0_20_49_13]|nr:MAG: hypothetical protein COV46_04870 [Deltaproteobacteria bacterium CG11_big_fil_rev_8_21_14_0_20_49_13]
MAPVSYSYSTSNNSLVISFRDASGTGHLFKSRPNDYDTIDSYTADCAESHDGKCQNEYGHQDVPDVYRSLTGILKLNLGQISDIYGELHDEYCGDASISIIRCLENYIPTDCYLPYNKSSFLTRSLSLNSIFGRFVSCGMIRWTKFAEIFDSEKQRIRVMANAPRDGCDFGAFKYPYERIVSTCKIGDNVGHVRCIGEGTILFTGNGLNVDMLEIADPVYLSLLSAIIPATFRIGSAAMKD